MLHFCVFVTFECFFFSFLRILKKTQNKLFSANVDSEAIKELHDIVFDDIGDKDDGIQDFLEDQSESVFDSNLDGEFGNENFEG